MRLRIQSAPPASVPDPAASGATPGTTPPPAPAENRPPRPVARSEKLLTILTGWKVALPMLIVSFALLGWSLVFRWPDPQRALAANARALPVRPSGDLPATPEALALLRQQVQEASGALCRKPAELAPLLSRLEISARKLGWRVETSLSPAIPQPGGLPELTLHPVVIQLEDTREPAEPSYARLLDWLRVVSSLDRRVEIASLQLRSAGSGLRKARIELHLFSLNAREEVSPK